MPPPESPEPGQPTGTVTLVFTDIEGSTRLLQALGDRYPAVLADHHRLIREAFARHGALERGSAGDGLYFVFQGARAAVQAAIDGQLAVAAWAWPDGVAVRDRMGLHTGEPVRATEGYVGLDVHRAARICAAGHGGQILISQTTRDLVADELRPPIGRRRSRRASPQLAGGSAAAAVPGHRPGLARDFPPPRTTDAPRNNLKLEVTSFIGREREIDQATPILEQSSLLTLTGPGGVGKTRIGLRLARELLDQFDDGTWVVECGALTAPGCAAVDRECDRPDRTGRPVAPANAARSPGERQAAAARPRRLRPSPGGRRRPRRISAAIVLWCANAGDQPRGPGRAGRGDPADRVPGDARGGQPSVPPPWAPWTPAGCSWNEPGRSSRPST